MGIVHSFEKGLDFWADAAVALGGSLPHQTHVVPQADMGYGVKATVTIEQGSKVAAYLLTGLSYIDPTCDTPLVYSFNLPLVKACCRNSRAGCAPRTGVLGRVTIHT